MNDAAALALALAGGTLLVGTGWERLVVAVAGFLVVRVVLTRWLGRPAEAPRRPGHDRRVTRGGT